MNRAWIELVSHLGSGQLPCANHIRLGCSESYRDYACGGSKHGSTRECDRVSAETNHDDAQLLKAWDPPALNPSREEH